MLILRSVFLASQVRDKTKEDALTEGVRVSPTLLSPLPAALLQPTTQHLRTLAINKPTGCIHLTLALETYNYLPTQVSNTRPLVPFD